MTNELPPAATSDGKQRPNEPAPAEDKLIAREQLKSVVERIERLEEEKKAIGDDIRDVYAEAKANGFDTKILRQVIKIRGMDSTEREEQQAVMNLYLEALGLPQL